MLFIVGGLSGSGKSTLGKHLLSQGLCWVELDGQGVDMVNLLGIRAEWDAFCNDDPSRLLALYSRQTVITLPSRVIVPEGYSTCANIRVRYLFGPKERCFGRARSRNPTMITQITQEFWDEHNSRLLKYLDSTQCPPGWKLSVFEDDGKDVPVGRLAAEVLGGYSRIP